MTEHLLLGLCGVDAPACYSTWQL